MAADRGSADASVEDYLFTEGYSFDFYQAVRLLELLYRRRSEEAGEDPDLRWSTVGVGSDPAREVVRFHSTLGMEFPSTDVAEIAPGDGRGGPARMEVAFMGLAGALGPLPQPFAELVRERAWRGDRALRDFLDLFNHRLVSLLYRAKKRYRPALHTGAPEESETAERLYAVLGLATPGLRGRMRVQDRALLRYAGLLAQRPRSLAGLLGILADYFGVPFRAEQFVGRWLPLEEDQTTRIGASGQNRRLGEDAVLGTRVWDQQGVFELRVGPLSLEELRGFLPGEPAFERLCDLTRFYVGAELDFTVRLVLRAGEMPDPKLSADGAGMRLGWTSWVGTRASARDDEQVRVAAR